MAEEVCGFLVVRKPDFAVGPYYNYNLRIDKKVYQGMDRLPWHDLGDAYYDGNISERMLRVWQQIELENKGQFGRELLRDYEAALVVQQAFKEQTEILAVWSPEFAEAKGSFSYSGPLYYLGLDCMGSWEWSVILYGPFQKPDIFAHFIPCLNEHGLLSSGADCDRLFKRYVDVSLDNEHDAEPLMDEARPTHVKVFLAG